MPSLHPLCSALLPSPPVAAAPAQPSMPRHVWTERHVPSGMTHIRKRGVAVLELRETALEGIVAMVIVVELRHDVVAHRVEAFLQQLQHWQQRAHRLQNKPHPTRDLHRAMRPSCNAVIVPCGGPGPWPAPRSCARSPSAARAASQAPRTSATAMHAAAPVRRPVGEHNYCLRIHPGQFEQGRSRLRS